MKHRASAAVLLLLACLAGMAVILAVPVKAGEIPPSLESWKDWVLHNQEEKKCPSHFDDPTTHVCGWSSRLTLEVGDQGALFEQQVTVYAPMWVTLPGDDTHWPESITGNDAPLPVAGRNGRPCIWLAPGDHRIRGAFVWASLPERIQVPAGAGMVSLTVNGREIAAPDLDGDGRLRLHGEGGVSRQEDAFNATLFRLIEDDIPMRVITRIMLEVSGRPREIRLDSLLPEGAVVMKIDSPLPARLADPGGLLVQARPGRWDIQVTVRLDGPVQTLAAGTCPYGDEIWSFKAFNQLRMVKVQGAPTLEPAHTRMPDEWKGYPAYLLKSGGSLSLDVIRRGDPDPAPDQLSLERAWWLDFDGRGFTVHDRISGTLSRTWHLAMGAPMALGRVAVDGQDQLITLQGDPPAPGVQLRRGQLSLEADSRLARAPATLPAVGWDHDFQQVHGVLHLPPGWGLFSANGVDVPAGAWLQQWTLLDFFLVLIIAVSTYKLRNRPTGGMVLVTLMLTFHEPGAPRLVWLHLLAAAALLKVLPDGRFKTLARLWGAGAMIALVAIALPFMVQQVRSAIFPQLAPGGGYGIDYRAAPLKGEMDFETQEAPAPEYALRSKLARRRAGEDKYRQYEQLSSKPSARFLPDPKALIQTGPGLPAWHWRQVQLRWNGPVDRSQQVRLWLISPALNLILGLVRVLLLAGLIAVFLDLRNWRHHLPNPLKAASNLLLILVLLASASPLRAETDSGAFPSQPLLDELRQRLLEPPPCMPHCADISRLELSATPDQLRLIIQAQAQVDTAIPLPATHETWRPDRVMLDDEAAQSLARDERGALWMVLPQGVHQIKMVGPAATDEIRIAFPIVPHMATFAGVGWQARGFRPDGRMEANIILTRVMRDPDAPAGMSNNDIPAFFQVTRTLHLGLQWGVTTQVQRLTEPGEPAVLSIPLLKGAALTTAGIQVKNGVAEISMGPEEQEARFSTTLPITPEIVLTAPRDVPWTETWVLDAASLWRCIPSGLTVVHHQDSASNWQPQWRPWPGEQVTISVTRPEAVPGRTITIDKAQLVLTPGPRLSRSVLTLNIRASKGGQHQIELPEPSNLQAVTLNKKSLPIRQDGRLVNIPLDPGAQTVGVEWLQLNDSMSRIQAPRVRVGDSAVNASVTINMPGHRWILFAGGPRLGPAVLFWSYVIVVLVIAFGLGKTTLTPLNTGQWMLLGMGLTQVPVVVAVLVAGWLLALGYRCRRDAPQGTFSFNLTQVLLVILTIAALAGLYTAIEHGLLGIPDMQVAGNHSTQLQLSWFQDRIDATLPTPWVVSLPQWSYHLLMLAWSLWLAFSLVAWLRWGWGCFAKTRLWQPIQWRRKTRKAEAEKTSPVTDAGAASQKAPFPPGAA